MELALEENFPLHRRMINELLPTAASPQKTTLYIRLDHEYENVVGRHHRIARRHTRMEDHRFEWAMERQTLMRYRRLSSVEVDGVLAMVWEMNVDWRPVFVSVGFETDVSDCFDPMESVETNVSVERRESIANAPLRTRHPNRNLGHRV